MDLGGRRNEGKTNAQIHRKAGIRPTGFSDGETGTPQMLHMFMLKREAELLHTDKQGDSIYGTQLDQANLSRRSFCRQAVFSPETSGERELEWTFSAYTVNTHTRTGGALLFPYEPHFRVGMPFSMGLTLGFLYIASSCQQCTFTRDFIHSEGFLCSLSPSESQPDRHFP